jgi:hypothetical protein
MSYSKADVDVISEKLTPMSYCTIGPLSGPVPSHPEAGHCRRGPPETPRNRIFTHPHPPTAETWPRHAQTPAAPSGGPAIRPGERGAVTLVAASPRPWQGVAGHGRSSARTARSVPPAGAHRPRVGASAGPPGPADPGGRNRIQFGFNPAGRSALVWPGPASAKQCQAGGRPLSGLPPTRSGKGGRIRGPSTK